jgi:hypothetical protein
MTQRLRPAVNAEELIRQGHEAKQLLEHPLFRAAVKVVEENIMTAWRAARTPQKREDCWHELEALTRVMQNIKIVFERGEQELELRDRATEGAPKASDPASHKP